MKKLRTRGSPVLLEILLVTLLFALTAGVTVRLVTQAYLSSRETARLDRAWLAMQDACEQAKAALRAGEEARDYTLWFDGDFLPAAEGAEYQVQVAFALEPGRAGTYYAIALRALDGEGALLAALDGGVYVAEELP